MGPSIVEKIIAIDQKTILKNMITGSTPNDSEKINFLYSIHLADLSSSFVLVPAMATSTILGYLLVFIAVMIVMRRRPSYLIITNADDLEKHKRKKRIWFNRIMAFISFFGTILAGILSNYLFYTYCQK